METQSTRAETRATGTFHRRQLARRVDVKNRRGRERERKKSIVLASNELTPEFAIIMTAETRGEM